MEELLLRRRALMMQIKGIDIPYIKDGLVFWLDGINHGADDGSWVDLIGGIKFTRQTTGSTLGSTGLTFSDFSKSYWIGDKQMQYITYNGGTIEVCLYPSVRNRFSASVFTSGAGTNAIALIYPVYNRFINGTPNANASRYGFLSATTTFHTISAYNNIAYVDGNLVNLTNIGNTSYPKTTQVLPTVGLYPNITGLPYTQQTDQTQRMKIYSIRVYNRALTDEEREHNRLVDIERFK